MLAPIRASGRNLDEAVEYGALPAGFLRSGTQERRARLKKIALDPLQAFPICTGFAILRAPFVEAAADISAAIILCFADRTRRVRIWRDLIVELSVGVV